MIVEICKQFRVEISKSLVHCGSFLIEQTKRISPNMRSRVSEMKTRNFNRGQGYDTPWNPWLTPFPDFESLFSNWSLTLSLLRIAPSTVTYSLRYFFSLPPSHFLRFSRLPACFSTGLTKIIRLLFKHYQKKKKKKRKEEEEKVITRN